MGIELVKKNNRAKIEAELAENKWYDLGEEGISKKTIERNVELCSV